MTNHETVESIPRKTFARDVDLSSAQAMAEFLHGHFRYHTSNSWNRSTSYACDMKATHLGLPSGILDKVFDMMDAENFNDLYSGLMQDFDAGHDYLWQCGFNGRSGGYLVLYQGKTEPSDYKSFCRNCGQRNFRSVAETGTKCGRCGADARVDFAEPPMKISAFPGRGTDMDMDVEDYMEWSEDELRSRTELVQELDALADAIVEAVLEAAVNATIQDETVYVPKTTKVIVRAGETGKE